MTTVILVTCPSCEQQEVAAEDVLLRVGALDHLNYGFTCPRCHAFVQKKANTRIVLLLHLAGISSVPADIPAEAFEKHTGAPLTADDLLDFHERLDMLDRETTLPNA